MRQLYDFLVEVYGEDNVALAYADSVSSPGFSCDYYEVDMAMDKNLDGTTNLIIHNYIVDIWNDSLLQVKESSEVLFKAMEGTEFQIQSIRPIRVDGNKRKWYQEVSVRLMEDVI